MSFWTVTEPYGGIAQWPQRLAAAVVAAVLVGSLAACGSDPTATPTATSAPAATPTSAPAPAATPTAMAMPTATPVPAWEAEWEEVIAAAKAEGQLILASTGSAEAGYRPIADEFERQFGIEVVYSGGRGSSLSERLLAEQAANRFEQDLFFMGMTSGVVLANAGALEPVPDYFVLPEVADPGNWYLGKHWFADPDQQYFMIVNASVSSLGDNIRYNTEATTQQEIDNLDSIWDLLEPHWRGRIVSLPPTERGSSNSYFQPYMHPEVGPQWIQRYFTEMDVTFSTDFRVNTDGIASGRFSMGYALAGSGSELDELATQGVPVARLTKPLAETRVLAAGSAGDQMGIPNRPPNPNATKLFVNWFLSQEGQEFKNANVGLEDPNPSLRTDVSPGKIAEQYIREPGKEYLFFDGVPETRARFNEALDYARQLYATLQ